MEGEGWCEVWRVRGRDGGGGGVVEGDRWRGGVRCGGERWRGGVNPGGEK